MECLLAQRLIARWHQHQQQPRMDLAAEQSQLLCCANASKIRPLGGAVCDALSGKARGADSAHSTATHCAHVKISRDDRRVTSYIRTCVDVRT